MIVCWGYTISGESLRPKNHLGWHARWPGPAGTLKDHHHHHHHHSSLLSSSSSLSSTTFDKLLSKDNTLYNRLWHYIATCADVP